MKQEILQRNTYAITDGVNRIPPLIIFHGSSNNNTKPFHEEREKYHPGVIVEFNDTAYMNNALFLKYIEQYLLPVLSASGPSSLLTIDACSSHRTSAVLDSLRQKRVIPSLIPTGCTSLVQPLDISINKPLKARIRDLTDEAIQECEDIEYFERQSVGDRRVLTTSCVGDAWYEFCIEKQDIVQQAFRNVGLSLPIDGSADCELNIKGFQADEIEVGDWHCKLDCRDEFADVNKTHDSNESVEFIAYGE